MQLDIRADTATTPPTSSMHARCAPFDNHSADMNFLNKIDTLLNLSGSYFDYEGLPVRSHCNPGASNEDLNLISVDSSIFLPEDYIQFLKLHNGCVLFSYEDLGGFEFLGSSNIKKENENQKNTYEEDWGKNLTVFCTVLGDGDFLAFRKGALNNYDILDCYHDDTPKNWKVICSSFSEFMNRLLDSKGKRFWL